MSNSDQQNAALCLLKLCRREKVPDVEGAMGSLLSRPQVANLVRRENKIYAVTPDLVPMIMASCNRYHDGDTGKWCFRRPGTSIGIMENGATTDLKEDPAYIDQDAAAMEAEKKLDESWAQFMTYFFRDSRVVTSALIEQGKEEQGVRMRSHVLLSRIVIQDDVESSIGISSYLLTGSRKQTTAGKGIMYDAAIYTHLTITDTGPNVKLMYEKNDQIDILNICVKSRGSEFEMRELFTAITPDLARHYRSMLTGYHRIGIHRVFETFGYTAPDFINTGEGSFANKLSAEFS